MFIDILSQPIVATTISVISMVIFAVVFLFSAKNWRVIPSVFIISTVLFVNFVLANNALVNVLSAPTQPDSDFYLRWVRYDAFSIISVVLLHLVLRVKIEKITKICMWLLLANTIYYLAMHLDIIVNGNRDPWLLWTLYTPVIHLVELSVAVSLFWFTAKNFTLKKSVTQ
jgi:hypothetical protein